MELPSKLQDELFSEQKNGNVAMNKQKIMKMIKNGYILTDITHLLVFPQKIAAAMLGIKIAILGKRFKEVTNRKWPFRYLSKIESDIEDCKNEEERNLLLKEKSQLLSPISIFIKKKK